MPKAYWNKMKKKTFSQEELNEVKKSKYYRNELEIFKENEMTIKIETTEFNVESVKDSNDGEYKKILIRNASIIESKPKINIELPIIIEHLWLLVDNGFTLEPHTKKLIINGEVNEYIHEDNRNIGVHAITIRCSTNKKIRETENIPAHIPEEFSRLVFNDIEKEIISAVGLERKRRPTISFTTYDEYEKEKYETTTDTAYNVFCPPNMPYEFIKDVVGGYAKYNNVHSQIIEKVHSREDILNAVIEYYTVYPDNNINIEEVTSEFKDFLLKHAHVKKEHGGWYIDETYESFISRLESIDGERFPFKNEEIFFDYQQHGNEYWTVSDYYYKHEMSKDYDEEYDYDDLESRITVIGILKANNYINLKETTSGEYQKEMIEFEQKQERYKEELLKYQEKMKNYEEMLAGNGLEIEDFGEFKCKKPKEPKKPINKDKNQIQIQLTPEAKNLIKWFSENI